MTTPQFGMTFTRPQTQAVPVLGADFSKMWLIETSEDADATTFPVNEPVRFSTGDTTYTDDLGTGYLADAVKGVHDQLDGVGADVVVTRVAEGVDAAATAANIVAALEDAASLPSQVNMTPRLVWAGRTDWRADLETTNPVVAALPTALNALLAIAVVDVDDTSSANAIDARETMASERMLPVGVAARVYEGETLVTRPMGPRVLGIFARVDAANGGVPFDPIANQPVRGIAALSRAIPFSLLDGSTEGQQMLEADVSIVVPGEVGVDGAVANGGATFIGTDNAATGELWSQIHQVRAADFITVQLVQITRQFLGQKITLDLAEAWLNSIRFALRDHKADDNILGYDVSFEADKNSPENIRLGQLTVSLGVEPAPAFKVANHEITRYRPAVEGLVADIIARLNSVA